MAAGVRPSGNEAMYALLERVSKPDEVQIAVDCVDRFSREQAARNPAVGGYLGPKASSLLAKASTPGCQALCPFRARCVWILCPFLCRKLKVASRAPRGLPADAALPRALRSLRPRAPAARALHAEPHAATRRAGGYLAFHSSPV